MREDIKNWLKNETPLRYDDELIVNTIVCTKWVFLQSVIA